MAVNVAQLAAYVLSFTYVTTVYADVSSSTLSTSASPAVHTVTAGYESGFQFIPNSTIASPGDIIVFYFETPGHSVVKADYGNPCIPFNTIHSGQPSFASGFINDTSPPQTWNLTINTTDPTFFYCSAPDACLSDHMIGAINPDSTQTLAKQAAYITNQTIMLQPGDPLPSEGSSISSTSSTSSSSTSATSTSPLTTSTTAASQNSVLPSPTPSSSTSSSTDKHNGISLSTGAVVGIVVAGVAILALTCALFWFIGRHRTMKQENSAIGRWVDSHSRHPSSVGAASAQGHPSSAPEMFKTWETPSLHGYASGCSSPQPQVQELGVYEISELGDRTPGQARAER